MPIIHREEPRDHSDVAELNRRAFGLANEARLVEKVRASSGFDPNLSLVAVEDAEVVGHILFSPIRIEADDGGITPATALAPMAVSPGHQRRGIGSALVRRGLDACREAGHAIVVVLGHAEYYPRFGFERASRYGIRAPFDVPDEAFMVLALTPAALDGVRGVVRYPPAFDDV